MSWPTCFLHHHSVQVRLQRSAELLGWVSAKCNHSVSLSQRALGTPKTLDVPLPSLTWPWNLVIHFIFRRIQTHTLSTACRIYYMKSLEIIRLYAICPHSITISWLTHLPLFLMSKFQHAWAVYKSGCPTCPTAWSCFLDPREDSGTLRCRMGECTNFSWDMAMSENGVIHLRPH